MFPKAIIKYSLQVKRQLWKSLQETRGAIWSYINVFLLAYWRKQLIKQGSYQLDTWCSSTMEDEAPLLFSLWCPRKASGLAKSWFFPLFFLYFAMANYTFPLNQLCIEFHLGSRPLSSLGPKYTAAVCSTDEI